MVDFHRVLDLLQCLRSGETRRLKDRIRVCERLAERPPLPVGAIWAELPPLVLVSARIGAEPRPQGVAESFEPAILVIPVLGGEFLVRIEEAIELCNGNVNRAAGLLEVAPSTLYRKLQGWKKRQA